MSQTTIEKGALKSTPLTISKTVFFALGPLEQLAAKALEQVGKVRIIEDTDRSSVG
jgi:hypothetical protein